MNDELFVLEEITTQLATWLMEERGLDVKEALRQVYGSKFYAKLQDPSTGLMSQSDAYLYDTLCRELFAPDGALDR